VLDAARASVEKMTDETRAEAADVANFLLGTSDMLARTENLSPRVRILDLRSTYTLVNECIKHHVRQKLYAAVYAWIEQLISLLQEMSCFLDEFLGAYALEEARTDIIIDLVKAGSSETERELFSPLDRAGVLNEFLDWLVADKDYCSGSADHRFLRRAVDLLVNALNVDCLFSWYRQGFRMREGCGGRHDECVTGRSVAIWAVTFLDDLNAIYTRHSLTNEPLGAPDETHVPLQTFAAETLPLRWLVAYRWFSRMQRLAEKDGEGVDNAFLELINALMLHEDCIRNLSEGFDERESDFVEILRLYVDRIRPVCARVLERGPTAT